MPQNQNDPNSRSLIDWLLGPTAPKKQPPLAPPPPAPSSAPPKENILSLSFEEAFKKAFQHLGNTTTPPPPTPAKLKVPILEPNAKWRSVIVHPSVVLVLGKRGSGKSALGYRLLELFRYRLRPHTVGVTADARRLLPEWIGVVPSLEEVPGNAIALVDEAYIPFHARASSTAEARAMSQLLNLSRQRDQTLIFVTQEARQVDRNIVSTANAIIFKDLGVLQMAFERPELEHLAADARQAFAPLTHKRNAWAYLYAPDSDFAGLLPNELPSFWSDRLSKAFAKGGTPADIPRNINRISPQERALRARQHRAQGASLREIAQLLGVTKGTVVNYLRGYPYRPRRESINDGGSSR